jgi:hypothetical protein
MQVTCGYGNRLPRIAALTLLLPALFGILYALRGPFLTQAGNVFDPAAPTRAAAQRLVETTDVRPIMSVIVAEVVEASWEATLDSDQRLTAVFTDDILETIVGDRVMSEQVGQMLESGRVTVDRSDEGNLPRAYFETQNETVRRWVEGTYERYLRNAELIDSSVLSS